ncbi:MAG: hypothetical protein RLY31_501, partial [Bacteroidota bacterium]
MAMFLALQLSAQRTDASLSRLHLSAGLGVVPTYVMDGASSVVPPVSLVAGYRFGKMFSLNGFMGYSESNSKPYLVTDGQSVYSNNRSLTIGLRSEVIKSIRKNIDFYGGGMLGFNAVRLQEYDQVNGQSFFR